MAFTSPKTRINQIENSNTNYISNFIIDEHKIPLVNGINVIIGENGAGKSSLLELLYDDKNVAKYINDLVKINKIKTENSETTKKLYVKQGDIVNKFKSGELFDNNNFIRIDNKKFIDEYNNYAKNLFEYIKLNIVRKESIDKLNEHDFQYENIKTSSTYFIDINMDNYFEKIENIYAPYRRELENILASTKHLLEVKHFEKYREKLQSSYYILKEIYQEIKNEDNRINVEQQVKNHIVSAVNSYSRRVRDSSTTEENRLKNYRKSKEIFVNNIVEAIKLKNSILDLPAAPEEIKGSTSNPKNGFNFNSETTYNSKEVKEIHSIFLETIFNKKYQIMDSLKEIDSEEKFIESITKNSSGLTYERHYYANVNKFIEKMCEEKRYIVDTQTKAQSLGGTLGELSLAYLKFIIENKKEKSIFLIDQPEDHISNNNISKKLIEYINNIRNEKQIIIVTHNPLLVVNLDVDQVIYLDKNKNKLSVTAGCLEFEHRDINMLDLIAEHMDGGKESIEKRLKVYG